MPTKFLFVISLVIIVGYYLTSYYNSLAYRDLLRKLNRKSINFKNGNVKVEVYQSSFRIKPIRNNYEATIHIKPKIDFFNYIYTGSSLILFAQV